MSYPIVYFSLTHSLNERTFVKRDLGKNLYSRSDQILLKKGLGRSTTTGGYFRF